MRPFLVRESGGLKGEITLPGDKSIAHRAVIISALACGKTVISNFPVNQDCLATLNALKKLGLKIIRNNSRTITVFGKDLHGLTGPKSPVFVGESGTTLRLLLGVLAGQNFSAKLIVAKSLSNRPMLRVNAPLRMMGAEITAKRLPAGRLPPACRTGRDGQGQAGLSADKEEYPPLTISGGSLKAITYKMPVASAQVKSAILLGGLYACGRTKVIEPIKTRDHTERMLKIFKADIKVKQNNIVIKGGHKLVSPGRIYIPGDISSASFFIVGAAILPDSRLLIKNVSLNPSRLGIINVLKRMNADIKVQQSALRSTEPAGDILIKSSKLKGITVKKKEIPSLIDELPILMVAACLAKGKAVFEGVRELRVKETDRIRSMLENLTQMGANIKVAKYAESENIVIEGGKKLKGAKVRSFSDHRTAMSMVIAGLVASGTTSIDSLDSINKSFPDFLTLLKPLLH
jgi:3-phosphoshikimate 1-carboxyvinyltransferase